MKVHTYIYIWFGLKFSLQQETMLVSYRRK